MARLVYGMLTSLDGYITGPEGGSGLPGPNEKLHRYFNESMKRTAAAIYGRRMYETMRAWDELEGEPNPIYAEFGEAWRAIPKLVVSTTLREVGPNARLVRSDVESAVRSLKADTEGEIEVAGADLAASLARLGLIDEYRLYMQPVVLGGGKPFFEAGLSLTLTPLGMESLPEGCTLLRYAPAA
jgi:dihydrofolate reductase